MLKKFTRLVAYSIAACVSLHGVNSNAQSIVFTGGSADINFFFDSENNTWDTVFRSKGSTQATGLDNPYIDPPGGVGGGTDFRFDTLRVEISDAFRRAIPGDASSPLFWTHGQSVAQTGLPDLGVRTRLRELDNGNQVDQFDAFSLTLDWDNSTRPDGAEFALFNNAGVVKYDTAAGLFTFDEWNIFGHTHYNWGFTELGEYNLAFNFQGLGGTHGPSSTGTVNIAFSVVPEPGSALMLIGVAGVLFGRRRRSPLA